jgi:hypothetical protein
MSFSPSELAALRRADAEIERRKIPTDPAWRKRPRISAKRRRLGFPKRKT